MRSPRPLPLLALCVASLVLPLLAGCGWRGEIDPRLAPLPDPDRGPTVRIGRVEDVRRFWLRSYRPWQPSLHGSFDDRSRAVGRRRQTRRGGNLKLPQDYTVSELVAETLTAGFRAAGYRVLDGNDGPDGARVVEAEIHELWIWMTGQPFTIPGFEFRARVRVRAPVAPFAEGLDVCGRYHVTRGGATAMTWERTVRRGLEQLAADVTYRLQAPEAVLPGWYCAPSPGVETGGYSGTTPGPSGS